MLLAFKSLGRESYGGRALARQVGSERVVVAVARADAVQVAVSGQ